MAQDNWSDDVTSSASLSVPDKPEAQRCDRVTAVTQNDVATERRETDKMMDGEGSLPASLSSH